MPSLVRFFAFAGTALWALLSFANFLFLPSTGATLIVPVPAKPAPAIVVEHDPRASKVERWRDEQAALKSGPLAGAGPNLLLAATYTAQPERFLPASPVEAAKPPATRQVAATAPANPQPAAERTSFVGVATAEEIAAERGRKAAERKAKVAKAKAKARKEWLARERAANQQFASNQQDQFYYGQQRPVAAPSSPAFAGVHATTAATRAPVVTKRDVRVATAKANARAERVARGPVAGQRTGQHANQQPLGMNVSAFAPQRSYGPFSRTW